MTRRHDPESDGTKDATAGFDRLECIDPEVGELLPFHAEGTLDAGDRPLFAAHLKACARCAEEAQLMREVARGIASLRVQPDRAAALGSAPRPGGTSAKLLIAAVLGVAAALALWLAAGRAGDDVQGPSIADVRALEARLHHLEAQNARLAHAVAQERSRGVTVPLVGIPIAAPPNL